MSDALIIIGAFILAGALIVLELFIPSNGVLTIAAVASLVYGIVRCFLVSQWLGFVVTIVTVATLPIFIVALVKIWPNTWVGKRIAIKRPPKAEPGESIPDAGELDKLLGQTGQAITNLRPVAALSYSRGIFETK